MGEQYEYFVRMRLGQPDALWRRAGQRWEFLSLLDWSWHSAEERPVSVPRWESLRPVSAGEAARLETDRQRWVRYWARYLDPPSGPGDQPLTVVRRRRSPERLLDESFVVGNRWKRTPAVVEYESGRASSPPHLVEIDQPTAERILWEVRGVEGATQL